MTASMHADVLRMCKGDKEKAKQMVSGLQGQMEEEKRRSQQRKIDELAPNFPSIDRHALVKILSDNDWDVEKAILPCFEFQEKEREAQRQKEREEQNKKREEERRARQAEARQQAKTFLVQLFSNVPEDKIQAMLEENEGDVDLTTDQLISMKAEEEEKQEQLQKRRKEEEEQLKRQAELEKQLKIDTLVQRYDLHPPIDESVLDVSRLCVGQVRGLLQPERDREHPLQAQLGRQGRKQRRVATCRGA